MIYTLFNVFDEASNLPRAMDSVEENFDDVFHITIDGRYPDYPSDHDFSIDGTREIAWRRGELLLCVDNECAKRTSGLRYIDTVAKDGDWVLYLDADEVITDVFAMPERVGCFSFTRDSRPEVSYDRCRLYRWEPGLHFSGRHYKLYDANDELVAGLGTAPDFQPVGHGIHYDLAHDKERRRDKKSYYTVLREQESGVPA